MTTTSRVRTTDGVDLHVEVDDGPGDTTVVLVHGFTASLEEFALQRAALQGQARVVLYDQRGHGASHHGRVRRPTIDQLARDLEQVLDHAAPTGTVVLLGHSMGGMVVMALARQRPELFGPRIVGAFLLATSAGRLVEAGLLGGVVRWARRLHLLTPLLLWLRLWAPLLDRLYRRGTPAGYRRFRRQLFGTDDAEPALVRQVQELLERTPLTVVAAFYRTLLDHDEHQTLSLLQHVPVTVLVGDSDRLTPLSHSRRMAELMPDAELVVVPGAGHSVNITRPEVVDAALLRLLDRARAQRAA